MPTFIDYTGKKIGRVMIIENVEHGRVSKWSCRCECGTNFICHARSFKRGDLFECKNCYLERKRGVDLTGRKFGRWTVLYRGFDIRNKTAWVVKCDCGNIGKVSGYTLGRQGKSMSCGCLGRKEKSKWVNDTLYPPSHGKSKTKINAIRTRIVHSCYKKDHVSYERYGGRGFTVCELWKNSASDFFNWCMENHWDHGHTILLKEGETVYSPENCYVIHEGEAISQRMQKKISYNGETKTMKEWAENLGVNASTIGLRLRRGYSIEEAIFSKSHKFSGCKKFPDEEIKKLYESGLTCAEIGRKLGFSYYRIGIRLKLMGINHTWKGKRKYNKKICDICLKEYIPTASKQKKCMKC